MAVTATQMCRSSPLMRLSHPLMCAMPFGIATDALMRSKVAHDKAENLAKRAKCKEHKLPSHKCAACFDAFVTRL